MKVVLASASIRRQELLKRVVEEFEIKVSGFQEESIELKGDLGEYVMEIAYGKAKEVSSKFEDALIIGCDTIVALDNEVLGKPKDEEDAIEMLKKLSGRDHQVYSGISIINTNSGEVLNEFVVTDVKFSELSIEDIKKYVDTKDPMDKAGAYGIQGKAGVFVEEIKGDYYSVVGLPLNKLYKMISRFDLNV